jgi:GntR family transcriptional regulator
VSVSRSASCATDPHKEKSHRPLAGGFLVAIPNFTRNRSYGTSGVVQCALCGPVHPHALRAALPKVRFTPRGSPDVCTRPHPYGHARPCGHTSNVLSVHDDDLDPESGRPLSQQIADRLEARIRSGELAPDRPVPSETTLGQEYPVSRDTIRRAIKALRDRGLVYTVQGKGSYVRAPGEWPTAPQ